MMAPQVIIMANFQTEKGVREEVLGIKGVPDLPGVGPAVGSLLMRMALGEGAGVAEVVAEFLTLMTLVEEGAGAAEVIG